MPPFNGFDPPAPSSRSPVATIAIVVVVCLAFVHALGLVGVFIGLLTMPDLTALARSHRTAPPAARAGSRSAPLPMILAARKQLADPAQSQQRDLIIGACVNRFSAHILDSHRHYQHAFGGNPPTGAAPPDELILNDVTEDPEACAAALRRATTIGPPDPALEAAGRRYLGAVRGAAATLNRAYPYYRNRDWQDDRMARGRAMHPAIVASFAEFASAHDALVAQLDAMQRGPSRAPCAGRVDPEDVVCLLERHQAAARQATVLAARATVAADGTVAGLDPVAFTAAVAALDAAVQQLSEGFERPSARRMRSEATDYVWNAGEHLRQVKALYRAARDHQRVDAEAWNTPGLDPGGSPSRIIVEFNRTVEGFDQLLP